MKFFILSFTLLFILFSFNGFSCPVCNLFKSDKESAVASEKKEVAKALSSCKLQIEGMTCGACVKAVEKALKNLTGVKEASVDLKEGTASVQYENEKVTRAEMIKAIKDAGFTASERR
jgi:copper ion binding protein